MRVHLVDGTYELFRYHFALPSHLTGEGREVAATRGVVGTCLSLLEDGATHVGVATDHVIESYRNELWPGYKDGSGIEEELVQQFPLVEEVLDAAGFTVFPMVEYEADDALCACAHVAEADERVEQVLICTPDKDLGQCVTEDGRIVQLDRRKGVLYDADGIREKFGVSPESIADYLALVGDSADGFPGLAGWGAKSTATVLSRYVHLEDIPHAPGQWDITVRGSAKLAASLHNQYEEALLFRTIATTQKDAPTVANVDELEWTGPKPELAKLAESIDAPGLTERAVKLAKARS
jgi:5'-3' exonuclease